MAEVLSRIPVYCIPGLGAGSNIFEHISLPDDRFEIYLIDWLMPESQNETLEHYVIRMAAQIKHKELVLIGVSFGGVIAQEMAKIIPVTKIILISSIKTHKELPRRMRILQKTRLYKLIPDKAFDDLEKFSKYAFGKNVEKKLKLYERYIKVRDKNYLIWAIENLLNWKKTEQADGIVQIHGNADPIFPIKYIKGDKIVVNGGNHAMILLKAREISEIISKVI